MRIFFTCLIFLGVSLYFFTITYAQQNKSTEGAFIRSLIVPGWGHYYVNPNQWNRGKVHLGTELVLIASYAGFNIRANNLENQYESLASLRADVDVSNRSRSFKIAVGEYQSLQQYNDFQYRSRNWNRLYEDESANRWNWESEKDRSRYTDLRSDVDRIKNQLPAILGLIVVNRVISAMSAYNRAKTQSNLPQVSLLPITTDSEDIGIIARFNLFF